MTSSLDSKRLVRDSKVPTSSFVIVLILGALTTVNPFSIDMYLPAFPQVAGDLHTTVARVSLSLSSYFVGLALGQIFYGPILDRFGRKRPLTIGLSLYILASVACLLSHSVESLVAYRFLQALGGCVAQVASIAMVRDFFPVEASAKIYALLTLILSVSPLLAPTAGSLVAVTLGWHWVFILLGLIVLGIMVVTALYLPPGEAPDSTVSLKPGPIFKNFWRISKNPQFLTYSLGGAFAYGGLFVYVAGSPLIFMEVYQVGAKIYGAIFALLAVGFVGTSQCNVFLTNRYSSEKIFSASIWIQGISGIIFWALAYVGWLDLYSTVAMFFIYLSSMGLATPNSTALALAPFDTNIGSASALLGFLQIGVAALASMGVGIFARQSALPIFAILAVASSAAVLTLVVGQRCISRPVDATASGPARH